MAEQGIHLANAYVSFSTNTRGLRKQIDEAMGTSTAGGEKHGKTLGSRVSSGFKTAAKVGFAGAGLAAGAALAKGFGRLKGLDAAEGKLKGLGHSTKTVDGIMNNALKSVKGTAFGMEEAATTAAGAVAAGVKPGKDLESVLTLVGDAATIGGSSMSEMGAIFNKVASTGKVQGDVLNQLGDQGIPIVQFLSKELGVSAGEVYKLASEGKVNFADFRAAMESGLGGAAQESGKTFSGAFANMGAAAGRLGASLLSGVFPQLKDGFGGVTDVLDRMGPAAEVMGAKLGAGISAGASGIGSFIADFKAGEGAAGSFRGALSSLWGSLSGAASSAFQALLPHLKTFASSMAALWPQVRALATTLGSFLGAAFRAVLPYIKTAALVLGGVFVGALKVLPPILSVVMSHMRGVLGVLRPLLPVIAAAAAGFVLYRGVMMAAGLAMKVYAAITKVVTAVTRIFNAVVRANPLGLLVTAIMLAVGALVYLYRNNETARRIMQAAWAGIKAVIFATVNWFTKTAWPAMKKAFQGIAAVAKWLWQSGIKPAFNGIGAVISWWYNNVIKRYFALVRAVFRGAAATAKWLWQKGIKPAFQGIAAVASWLWKRVKSTFAFMKLGFQGMAAVAKWLWGKIKAYFRGISATTTWLWGKVKATFAFMRRGFQGVGAIAKWLWGQIKAYFRRIADNAGWLWGKVKAAFDKMKSGMRSVKNAVVTARDGIKSAWSKIYGYIKSPIVKALKWLQNNFVKKLRGFLGKIPGVSANLIPNISLKGFDTGGYTGPGSKYQPAGVVHADEFVLRKEATNKLRKTVGLSGLDHMNRTGEMPGYARGGYVYPSMVRWIKNKVPAGVITSTKRNWGTGSYHDVGKAIDVGGSSAVMKQVASAIQRGFGNKIAELIHNPGFSVKNGKRVSSGFWGGSTWGAHRDHVHWAMNSMSASALKGMSGFVDGAFTEDPGNWFEKKLKAITSKFSPKGMGLAGEVIPAVMKSVKNGIKKRVVDAMSISVGDTGPGMSFSGVASGTNQVMGKALAAQAGWTGGQWLALKELWRRESQWNHKAKNPSSGAYGIPQSLPASKMASAGGDWRTNAQTQIRWGLNYIRGRYGSPSAALAFHNRKNWYDRGGIASGAGLMHKKTLEPERVLSPRQTVAFEDWMRATPTRMSSPAKGESQRGFSGPVVVNVIDRDGSFVDRMRGEIAAAEGHAATRSRMRSGRRF